MELRVGTAITSLSLGFGRRSKQDGRSRFSRKAPSTATVYGTRVPRAWCTGAPPPHRHGTGPLTG